MDVSEQPWHGQGTPASSTQHFPLNGNQLEDKGTDVPEMMAYAEHVCATEDRPVYLRMILTLLSDTVDGFR